MQVYTNYTFLSEPCLPLYQQKKKALVPTKEDANKRRTPLSRRSQYSSAPQRIQTYINKNVIHSMKLTLKQWILIASAVIGAVIVSSSITSLILMLE